MQFELPWELGPEPGRYVLRDSAAESELRVLVVGVVAATPRLPRRRRAAQPEPPPTELTVTRATVIRGQPVGEGEAAAWVADADAGVVEAELAVLNRTIALHRVASADATVREVRREQAVAIRVGYGRGEEVADGKWTEAVTPGRVRVSRRAARDAALRPQERLAALLGGRDAALACEELALRARADLDAGRFREAALQLRVALEAAIAELEPWRERGDLAARIGALRDERGAVGAAANAALCGGLDADTIEDVSRVLGRIEAALRARTAGGFG